jgi:hypothetical protein
MRSALDRPLRQAYDTTCRSELDPEWQGSLAETGRCSPMTSTAMRFSATRQEAVGGMRCPARRLDNLRPAGAFMSAQHAQDLCLVCPVSDVGVRGGRPAAGWWLAWTTPSNAAAAARSATKALP